MRTDIEILEFVGTCSTQEIGDFAAKTGKKKSWNKAKQAIKNYNEQLYSALSLDLKTYYEQHTQIIEGTLFGVEAKYLHIIHSAVDYIFRVQIN